jgi:hypothetical protein
MKKNLLASFVAVLALLAMALPAFAVEAFMMRESDNPDSPAGAPLPCPLAASLNGTCANYKWYNACANYIWIFSAWSANEGVGVKFGKSELPCVTCDHRVKRGIFYFRNIVPAYGQFVDLYLDADCNQDGCPEGVLGSALNQDPGLRWNCAEFNACIPCDGVILRQVHHGGVAPTFATDGPFKAACDPNHPPTHSYYYGQNSSTCVPWVGVPATDPDDFFMWLVVDNDTSCPDCPTSTEPTSWGNIKGLYQ